MSILNYLTLSFDSFSATFWGVWQPLKLTCPLMLKLFYMDGYQNSLKISWIWNNSGNKNLQNRYNFFINDDIIALDLNEK